jgi:hypothetical protein
VQVLDQLLYLIPVLAAALVVISLFSRRASFRGRARRDATTDERQDSNRTRVVSGLTSWLALRLVFVWVIVLLVRLVAATF